MGNGLSKAAFNEEELEWARDTAWLQNLAKEIEKINPSSKEFRDLKWMQTNKDRILGNSKLIELLR